MSEYVMVPSQPTKAMIEAGQSIIARRLAPAWAARNAWDSMLSAAASPDQAGAAEPQVGRAVYERIEKLVGINPKPGTSEWIELDYLSHLTESVEEFNGYDGPLAALSAPAPQGIGREAVRVDDLAMLIRMLVRYVPETKQIRAKALDYLGRHDLMGSPLREDDLALLPTEPPAAQEPRK